MSGLIGLLDLGASALLAQNAGVATTGRNLANVNTEGYSRERIDLQSLQAAPMVGGVRAVGPRRVEDMILASRERLASSAFGQSSAQALALGDLEVKMSAGGQDLVGAVAALFGGIMEMAAVPTDEVRRGAVVASGEGLAAAFRRSAEDVAQAMEDTDARIRALAEEVSRLSATVASANTKLVTDPDPVLADQRDLAAKRIAEITGGSARLDPDGQMRVVVAGGEVLVDGDRASQLKATPDAALGGKLRLDVVDGNHVADVTTRLDGGKLAGEIRFRDTDLVKVGDRIDQLAFDFATQMNATHRANAGMDGVSGRDFFVEPTSVSGAAAAMAVDPTIAADPTLLAGAAAGAGVGDNQGFLAMAAMAEQALAGGGSRSFGEEAIAVFSDLGSDVRRAEGSADLEGARVDVLAAARDSLSGVSPEEEMSRLAAFQRASQAATSFLQTVDDMLGHLIERL
jgi:flagellar hook-associated protein 1 FlgK